MVGHPYRARGSQRREDEPLLAQLELSRTLDGNAVDAQPDAVERAGVLQGPAALAVPKDPGMAGIDHRILFQDDRALLRIAADPVLLPVDEVARSDGIDLQLDERGRCRRALARPAGRQT